MRPPEFSTCHYFSFGGPCLLSFFMRPLVFIMRPMLVIMRPLIIYFNFIWGPPDFTTCHYFSFGGPSLNFFMRPLDFSMRPMLPIMRPLRLFEKRLTLLIHLYDYIYFEAPFPFSYVLLFTLYSPSFIFFIFFFSFLFPFFPLFLFFLPFRARPPSPQGGSTCSQCSPPGYGPATKEFNVSWILFWCNFQNPLPLTLTIVIDVNSIVDI